jgi:hypothetical protein
LKTDFLIVLLGGRNTDSKEGFSMVRGATGTVTSGIEVEEFSVLLPTGYFAGTESYERERVFKLMVSLRIMRTCAVVDASPWEGEV